MDIHTTRAIRRRHTGTSITGHRTTTAARGAQGIGAGCAQADGGGDTAIIGNKASLIDRIKKDESGSGRSSAAMPECDHACGTVHEGVAAASVRKITVAVVIRLKSRKTRLYKEFDSPPVSLRKDQRSVQKLRP
jgi:hypothetical protein